VVVASLVVPHTNLWAKVWSGSWTNLSHSEQLILLTDMLHPKIRVSETLKGSLSKGVHSIGPAGLPQPIWTTNGEIRVTFTWSERRWRTPASIIVDQPCIWFLSGEPSTHDTNATSPSVNAVWLAPLTEKKYWSTLIGKIEEDPPEIMDPDPDDPLYKIWEILEIWDQLERRMEILGN
jgi:hypothetical protein